MASFAADQSQPESEKSPARATKAGTAAKGKAEAPVLGQAWRSRRDRWRHDDHHRQNDTDRRLQDPTACSVIASLYILHVVAPASQTKGHL